MSIGSNMDKNVEGAKKNYTCNDKCLCCGSKELVEYLDLGKQPLANSYHKNWSLGRFPLAMQVCKECWHNQLTVSVSPSEMFDHYVYISDTSQTLTNYFEWLCEFIIERNLNAKNILEIASNSGLFLEMFKKHGLECKGVDPAQNLRVMAEARGLDVLTEYWNRDCVSKLDRKYDLIAAIHVLPHVPDPLNFLIACNEALEDKGRVYIQTSQCNMFENNEFDACYHEHSSYFTAHSFATLARRAGFTVTDVKKVPIHSMSFLFELQKGNAPHCKQLEAMQFVENRLKLNSVEGYQKFAEKANTIATELADRIDNAVEIGMKVVGYGASAKGNTVLNFINRKLEYIVDDNELKQGYLTPGMDVPIVGIDVLAKEEKPVLIVMLAWNFADEIMERVKKVTSVKHKFVKYFPEVEVVE